MPNMKKGSQSRAHGKRMSGRWRTRKTLNQEFPFDADSRKHIREARALIKKAEDIVAKSERISMAEKKKVSGRKKK